MTKPANDAVGPHKPDSQQSTTANQLAHEYEQREEAARADKARTKWRGQGRKSGE